MKQLSHKDTENIQRSFPITIVCEELRTPENIGMCFRICESFGVEKIYIHKNSPSPENRIVKRTARDTLKEVAYQKYDDFKLLIEQLKHEGNVIVGVEITDKSIAIQNFNFKSLEKIVLVLGSERHGIKAVDVLDETISIPMYGKNSSMNVIHSLTIALYEVTNQLLEK